MIVRILGEGQLELADDDLDHLNSLDSEVEAAISAGDEDTFRQALTTLLDAVRERGSALADDAVLPSDAVLPGPDSSLDEVRDLLGDEGLIPG